MLKHPVLLGSLIVVLCILAVAFAFCGSASSSVLSKNIELPFQAAERQARISWLEQECAGFSGWDGLDQSANPTPETVEEASRFYGDRLPEYLVPVYNVMREDVLADKYETSLPYHVTKNDISLCWKALKMDLVDVIFEKPPLMVLGGSASLPVSGIQWDNRLSSELDEQTQQATDEVADELADSVAALNDDYDKARFICDEVASDVVYETGTRWAPFAYGATLGSAQCTGYSRLSVIALRKAGVNAVAVMGMAMNDASSPECHEWVAVFGDDGECRWYDPTWESTNNTFLSDGRWFDMVPEDAASTHRSFCEELFAD